MKRALIAAVAATLFSGSAFAAQPKTYQVTGEVLDVGTDTITVKKGSEKWEIGRTGDTKTEGEPKKGDKVTIEYRMIAAKIETKTEGGGKAKGKK